jgi:hypothetical protein
LVVNDSSVLVTKTSRKFAITLDSISIENCIEGGKKKKKKKKKILNSSLNVFDDGAVLLHKDDG